MTDLTDKDMREMRRIHESIPQDLQRRLIMKRAVTPNMAKAVLLGLREPHLDTETRRKLQHIKDSGILNQKEEVVNKSVQKKIDKYIEGEVIKSIKAGRLSQPEKGTTLSKKLGYE